MKKLIISATFLSLWGNDTFAAPPTVVATTRTVQNAVDDYLINPVKLNLNGVSLASYSDTTKLSTFSTLTTALSNGSDLQILDLTNCNLTLSGLNTLLGTLSSSSKQSLQSLILDKNPFSDATLPPPSSEPHALGFELTTTLMDFDSLIQFSLQNAGSATQPFRVGAFYQVVLPILNHQVVQKVFLNGTQVLGASQPASAKVPAWAPGDLSIIKDATQHLVDPYAASATAPALTALLHLDLSDASFDPSYSLVLPGSPVCSQLVYLNISGLPIPLTDDGKTQLTYLLTDSNYHFLQTLIWKNPQFVASAKGTAVPVADMFSEVHNSFSSVVNPINLTLTTIDISGANGLPVSFYKQLGGIPTIIARNFNTRDASNLIQAIASPTSAIESEIQVETLDLTGGSFGQDIAKVLKPLLDQKAAISASGRYPEGSLMQKLKHLILDGVALGASGVTVVASLFDPVSDHTSSSTPITTPGSVLSLKNVKIGKGVETALAPWATMLAATKIPKIYLNDNGIDSAGLLCLLSAIAPDPTMGSGLTEVIVFGEIPLTPALLLYLSELGLSYDKISPTLS